jgi:signal transduction histidine kinase
VLANGSIKVEVTSTRLKIHEERTIERGLHSAVGASMTANYFIDTEIPRMSRTVMRQTLKSNGGIRVFHNGFRVLPYGEPSDDWVGLDRSDRRRTLLPPHDNQNFLGFVQVDDRSSSGFVEVSSREGFVANQSFIDLRKFVYEVVSVVVLMVAEAREKKTKSGGRKRRVDAPELQEVESIASRLEQIEASLVDGSVLPIDAVVEVRAHAQELVAKSRVWFDERQSILKELELLRVLGSMGLAINEFTHEVLLTFASLFADLEAMRSVVGDVQQLSRVRTTLTSFKAYISFFERSAGAAVLTRERKPLEIRDVLTEFRTLVEPRLARKQLGRFETVTRRPGMFTSALHHSEWMSVFINLATNAFKAIARSGRSGFVLIEADVDDKRQEIVVRVSDDGIGVSDHIRDRIFDPFFTTFDEATEPDDLKGMGLGLSIVRDIIVSSGGTIEVVAASPGFATTFEIRVPALSRESIDELY